MINGDRVKNTSGRARTAYIVIATLVSVPLFIFSLFVIWFTLNYKTGFSGTEDEWQVLFAYIFMAIAAIALFTSIFFVGKKK